MSALKPYPIWDERFAYPQQEKMCFPVGIQHILAHDGRTDILPFLHDLAIAVFDEKIYIAWYNSTDAEICGTSLIRGRSSPDGGDTWSEPFVIAGSLDAAEEHFVPVNFFPHNGSFYATITKMAGKNMTTALDLFVREKGHEQWRRLAKISEGFICNTAPILMDNGNYISPGWIPMKEETPAFPVVLISHGDNIEQEWHSSFLYDPLHPNAIRIRCPETTLDVNGRTITAYVRNDEGLSYIFISEDYGETWSKPYQNPMPVGNSKLFTGRLSNGKKYVVYNAERGYFVRTLLVVAVAESDSTQYSKVYKVLEDESADIGRGSIWFYPCACEYNGFLYVACTLQEPDNIRSAIVAKIPIESL